MPTFHYPDDAAFVEAYYHGFKNGEWWVDDGGRPNRDHPSFEFESDLEQYLEDWYLREHPLNGG